MHDKYYFGLEQSLFIGLTVFIGLYLWHWHFIVVTIVNGCNGRRGWGIRQVNLTMVT